MMLTKPRGYKKIVGVGWMGRHLNQKLIKVAIFVETDMTNLMEHTRNALDEVEKMITVIKSAEIKFDTFCATFALYQLDPPASLFADDKIDALRNQLQAAIECIPENRTTPITNLSLTVLRLKTAQNKNKAVDDIAKGVPNIKNWFREIRAEADDLVRRLGKLYANY